VPSLEDKTYPFWHCEHRDALVQSTHPSKAHGLQL